MNLPCLSCSGPTIKNGFAAGKQMFKCKPCGKSFIAPENRRTFTNPRCRLCAGVTRKNGRTADRHKKRVYQCVPCNLSFIDPAVRVNAPMSRTEQLEDRKLRKERYFVLLSKGYSPKQAAKRAHVDPLRARATVRDRKCLCGKPCLHRGTCSVRFRLSTADQEKLAKGRRVLKAKRSDLLKVINNALPLYLPELIREDICQEIALAALRGDADITNLSPAIAVYKKKINGLTSNRFQFISVDMPLPGTDGLKLADVLVG